ncbi:MAG: glutamine-synthetase adenylyltransferase, partial [Pseudoxanthomonas sp.]
VALLGAATGAGRLYDVDVRLRPDGAKGLLVSSLSSYRDYQLERAWTWEHQALVRARGVAGDESLLAEFDAIRALTLSQSRETRKLQEEVGSMRLKMRAELDRSDAARFDLKQGAGGLVDLEFLLQYLVLRDSSSHATLLRPRDTRGLVAAVRGAGLFDDAQAQALLQAHATFLSEGLACTLDRRPRLVAENEPIADAREAVRTSLRVHGLVFDLDKSDATTL